MSEPEVKSCLEVTGNIVIAAMRGNDPLAKDADALAAFFATVYSQVYKSALTKPTDI